MNEQSPMESTEDELPKEVTAALRQRNGLPVKIPNSVEKAVLADAASHLSQISRARPVRSKNRRFAWVAWSSGTLAAAALLFAVLPSKPELSQPDSIALSTADQANLSSAALLQGDIDQSGEVNILDAFALARGIESGGELTGWDQNGDGRTDQVDIALIAQRAVTL